MVVGKQHAHGSRRWARRGLHLYGVEPGMEEAVDCLPQGATAALDKPRRSLGNKRLGVDRL